MKFLLLPFSWLYALVMVCRNKAFDLGVLKVEDVGVPVISVGNMTMGGTGKTPLVEYIVRHCLARGRKVAVVSRGYGRESSGVIVVSDGKALRLDSLQGGDEPVQIAKKFPEAIVVVGERRVEGARKAVSEMNADVIVLDDGFQHRYIKRNLDIVVLDSRKDVHTMPMIPAGERREPLSELKRAHLVAFSRSKGDTGNVGWMSSISVEPRIHYGYRVDRISRAGSNKDHSAADMKGTKLFLFSGIGDHQGFVDQMAQTGLEVAGEMKFPDHHAYTKADLQRVLEGVSQSGADALLTTEKDFVRLSGNNALLEDITSHFSLFYAGIVVDILQGKETLDLMIDRCLTRNHTSW